MRFSYLGVLAGIAFVMALALVVMLSARWVVERIGQRLIDALTWIMGLILIAVVVEFIASGIKQFYGL